MASSYVGDIGTTIRVATLTDLTTATLKRFEVTKPNASTVNWTAIVPVGGDPADGILVYEVILGDLSLAGAYKLQAYVEFSDGSKYHGELASFTVKALGE